MSQPPNQEPLYPDAAPSSPYSPSQGPTSAGYGPPQSPYPPASTPYPNYTPSAPSYQPASPPYPGYVPPSAIPSYPPASTPYQGNFQPSGYLPNPPQIPLNAKRASSRPAIALAVIGVLLVVGILHYAVFGPASAVKAYIHDIVQYNGSAAYSLVCADQHNSTLDAAFAQISQGSSSGFSYDDSGLQYRTSNWGLTSATVHLSGSLSASYLGFSHSAAVNDDVQVQAAGFGWCIETSTTNLGSSTST